VAKGTGSIVQDAIPFSKGKQKLFKDTLTPSIPKADTSAQDAALAKQRLEQADLDEEENRRRKRLLAAATGPRAYAGSPLFRRAPGDRAGSIASVVGSAASRAVGGGGRGGVRPGSMLP
jgi:hypothetical protein